MKSKDKFEMLCRRLHKANQLNVTPTQEYMDTGKVPSVPNQLELPLDLDMANDIHTHRFRDQEIEDT